MVKRVAAAGETFAIAGWREDAGFLLFHFPTWAKARAMQHWIDRSGIAHRADADALQRAVARGGRVITLTRLQFVTGLGKTTSPQRGLLEQTTLKRPKTNLCGRTLLRLSLGRALPH